MKRRIVPLAFAATVALAGDAWAVYCPSYTLSSSSNDHECGIEAVPGTNPSVAEWTAIFDLVAQGPSVWGNAGPSVSDIGQGCGKPEANHAVPARFPCELLKAIAQHESGWTQFCAPQLPPDQVGKPSQTIISFDCGYGIGQVTSGMHVGESPGFDRQLVASDPTYNMATGTSILAGKWKATNCVGDNQPSVVEHWYTATWAYNGLAYVNNPNNPNKDPNRGVYDPAVGGEYTYQERVFGRIENPTDNRWTSVKLAYPNRADCGTTGSPPELPEPECASPTDCVNKRSTHVSNCFPPTGPDAGAAGSSGSGGSGGTAGSSGAGGTAFDASVESPDAHSDAMAVDASLTDAGGSAGAAGRPSGAWQSEEASGCACGVARTQSSSWECLASLGILLGLRRRRGIERARGRLTYRLQ